MLSTNFNGSNLIKEEAVKWLDENNPKIIFFKINGGRQYGFNSEISGNPKRICFIQVAYPPVFFAGEHENNLLLINALKNNLYWNEFKKLNDISFVNGPFIPKIENEKIKLQI